MAVWRGEKTALFLRAYERLGSNPYRKTDLRTDLGKSSARAYGERERKRLDNVGGFRLVGPGRSFGEKWIWIFKAFYEIYVYS